MRVLTRDEMREFDSWAIEQVGIPGSVLMENAAIGAAEVVGDRYPGARSVGVLCGPGNNGGDGFALARQLETRGYDCRVVLAVAPERLSADARQQLEICEALEIVVERSEDESLPDAELWVDALFGTGLSRPLEGRMERWARTLNDQVAPVLALDLPSGLDATLAYPIGPCVQADTTVTFGALKVAHVLDPSAKMCGELALADLGVPYRPPESTGCGLHLLTHGEAASWVQPRENTGHKGDYGHVLVIGGSVGMSGAAVLAGRGAVRAGAGLVTLMVPAGIREECAAGLIEAMTLSSTGDGERFGAGDTAAALEESSSRDVVALGPGLGAGDVGRAFVRALTAELERPLVLDADALGAFSGDLAALQTRTAPTVLTPHPGEMARLLGISTAEVLADRLAAVRRAASSSASIVVLKGHQSLIAAPNGEVWVNSTGNPGMASGGSGDVLCGVIAGLLAQDFEALAAAQIGVLVHGMAGDWACERIGQRALSASDIVENLGAVQRRLFAEGK